MRRALGAGARGRVHARVLRRRSRQAVRAAARAGAARRHRAAVAGLREPRHVPRLRPSRRGVRRRRCRSSRHERAPPLTHAAATGARRGPAPRPADARPGARHRAARAGHGDLGFDLDRRPGDGEPFYLPRAPAAAGADRRGAARRWRSRFRPSGSSGWRCRCCCSALALLLLVLVPGLGHVGQRQPPLAALAGVELPGLGARARADADLHRQLRGAASRRRCASGFAGPGAAAGAAGLHGAAAAAGAGLRRRHGAVRHRLRRAVPRRRAAALRAGDAARWPAARLALLVVSSRATACAA